MANPPDILPSLGELPACEQERLVRYCRGLALRCPLMWLVIVLCMGIVLGMAVMNLSLLSVDNVVGMLVVNASVAAALGLLLCHVFDMQTRRMLWLHHPIVCQRCGYNLRGSLQAARIRCPECDRRIRPDQFHYHNLLHPRQARDDAVPWAMLARVRPAL